MTICGEAARPAIEPVYMPLYTSESDLERSWTGTHLRKAWNMILYWIEYAVHCHRCLPDSQQMGPMRNLYMVHYLLQQHVKEGDGQAQP